MFVLISVVAIYLFDTVYFALLSPPNHFQVLMNSPNRQESDEPELRLPDLDVMARNFQTGFQTVSQTVANELPKFRNIPA
jgi:hypothetical protein